MTRSELLSYFGSVSNAAAFIQMDRTNIARHETVPLQAALLFQLYTNGELTVDWKRYGRSPPPTTTAALNFRKHMFATNLTPHKLHEFQRAQERRNELKRR